MHSGGSVGSGTLLSGDFSHAFFIKGISLEGDSRYE